MVPNKFNVVNFGGFDLVRQLGESIPGIFDTIVDAHWNCVYIMCFGLKFAGIDIAPQYMSPELSTDGVVLNGNIHISSDDVITVSGIAPVGPTIIPLSVEENGTIYAPEGVDGFNPVTAAVPSTVPEVYVEPTPEEMSEGSAVIYLTSEMASDQKPDVTEPLAGIAGQNPSTAIQALNASGTPSASYNWSTSDRNYNNLWIGADFGSPVVLNFLTVAPRTWNNNRQIYTAIVEASNDLVEWYLLGTSNWRGNEFPLNKWTNVYIPNQQSYRYYRLRTTLDESGTINGSVTFTLYGLGFGYTQETGFIAKAFYKKSGTMYTFIRQ